MGLLFTERLYRNETDITLPPFKILFTVQMTRYYKSELLCLAVFYAIDDLVFTITMKQKFLEAYKHLIEVPWSLDNWDSPYALWFDSLELSD